MDFSEPTLILFRITWVKLPTVNSSGISSLFDDNSGRSQLANFSQITWEYYAWGKQLLLLELYRSNGNEERWIFLSAPLNY